MLFLKHLQQRRAATFGSVSIPNNASKQFAQKEGSNDANTKTTAAENLDSVTNAPQSVDARAAASKVQTRQQNKQIRQDEEVPGAGLLYDFAMRSVDVERPQTSVISVKKSPARTRNAESSAKAVSEIDVRTETSVATAT